MAGYLRRREEGRDNGVTAAQLLVSDDRSKREAKCERGTGEQSEQAKEQDSDEMEGGRWV